jgi:hypothetical protein
VKIGSPLLVFLNAKFKLPPMLALTLTPSICLGSPSTAGQAPCGAIDALALIDADGLEYHLQAMADNLALRLGIFMLIPTSNPWPMASALSTNAGFR